MEPKSREHFAFRFCVVVSQIALTLCSLELIKMIVNERSISTSERTLDLEYKDSPLQRQNI
jgi:hypothetical protein